MGTYSKSFREFDRKYLMYIPLTVIFQSCLGSIAAMSILLNGNDIGHMLQLFLCICVSMMYNSAIMAQLKHKIVFNLLVLSIFVNIALLIINMI